MQMTASKLWSDKLMEQNPTTSQGVYSTLVSIFSMNILANLKRKSQIKSKSRKSFARLFTKSRLLLEVRP